MTAITIPPNNLTDKQQKMLQVLVTRSLLLGSQEPYVEQDISWVTIQQGGLLVDDKLALWKSELDNGTYGGFA